LGAGGMGQVFLAEDLTLHRSVALKFLPENQAADPELRERQGREASALAALSHPNIATVHALETSGDRTFLVMEFFEGETLSATRGCSLRDPAHGPRAAHGAAFGHPAGAGAHRSQVPAEGSGAAISACGGPGFGSTRAGAGGARPTSRCRAPSNRRRNRRRCRRAGDRPLAGRTQAWAPPPPGRRAYDPRSARGGARPGRR